MPKRLTIEEQLARVSEIARAPLTDDAVTELRELLASPYNLVVARVAQVMTDIGRPDFVPSLANACRRLLRQPATADKTCRAKEALVQALDVLGGSEPDVFLDGIRHVQMEPVYGGRVDTAANLRGHCAVALARLHYAEAHFVLINLLVDPELPARLAAVQAVTYLGDERSELLLRLKVLMGDAAPEVLGGCFTGLLLLEPERSLPFVTDFLTGADLPLAEQAALALGESHLDGAFTALRDCWEHNTIFELRKSLLLAIALTRSDTAIDFLCEVIRDGDRSSALLSLDALAIYAANARQRERIRAVVLASRDAKIRQAFERDFSDAE